MDKTVPTPAGKILDFIASFEAPKGYETVYGNNQRKLAKPITQMTLGELLAQQINFTHNFGSSACGRYQFMRDTLIGLKSELGLRDTQLFDPNLQDRLGYHLLRRRGYDKWQSSQISDVDFMINLAKEWASFPVPIRMKGAHRMVEAGETYYAGDKLNKCLVTPSKVKGCLVLARALIPVTNPALAVRTMESPLPEGTEPMAGTGFLINSIAGAITSALVKNPDVPVGQDNAVDAQVVIADTVINEVGPVIDHLTNNEPWYQSRVTLGALASIIAGVAAIAGYAWDAGAVLQFLIAIGPVVGGFLALYGRWAAKKPIGA
jgi:muramidase (phage lysozyme)